MNIALAAVGGSVLVLGLLSGLIRRSILSEPLVALLVGVLLGPAALGLLDPAGWGSRETILELAARLTLAISLMGVALRLPKREPLKGWRSLAVLLGLVMPLMWLTSGLLVYLILGVPLLMALLVGAVVTPTDPVVSSTIVTGDLAEKNLPDRVRYYALLDERTRELQEAFLYGPPPLGPGAPPVERLRAFLFAYVDDLETRGELNLMAETASPGARYRSGGYRAYHAHVAALVREARPDADAEYLAEALLAPLAAELYAHQRRERGMSTKRIKAGLDELLRCLVDE